MSCLKSALACGVSGDGGRKVRCSFERNFERVVEGWEILTLCGYCSYYVGQFWLIFCVEVFPRPGEVLTYAVLGRQIGYRYGVNHTEAGWKSVRTLQEQRLVASSSLE
jgi:hypothetical protein